MAVLTNGVANGKRREEPVDISVALRPNDSDSVPSLIKDISAAGNGLSPDDGAGRLRLLEKARDLVRALETPRETMIKHLWAQVGTVAAFGLSKVYDTDAPWDSQHASWHLPSASTPVCSTFWPRTVAARRSPPRWQRHLGSTPLCCVCTPFQAELELPLTSLNRPGRLLRHVAAMGYIIEVAADEYKPTNFTRSLTIPSIGDGYPCV